MSDPRELPQQVTDLIELAKRYLRQETVDPLKSIGRSVARALLALLFLGVGAVLLALGLHGFLGDLLPDGSWNAAGAALITAVVALAAAAMVAGRLRTDDD